MTAYLKKGITEFLPRWKANGWLKSNREPILNQNLWDQLDQVAHKHDIQWEWIRRLGPGVLKTPA